MRILNLHLIVLVAMTCWGSGADQIAMAQSAASGSDPGAATPVAGVQPSPVANLPGGAAMADFDTLMNLIQQTVDPDSWLIAGGTSTLLPYPAGVYVDPQGHLQRLRTAPAVKLTLPSSASAAPRHPWRTASPLRTISLKRLDEALGNYARSGLRPTSELLQLAGLSRIQYVKLDIGNEDILLAGPADSRATPGFLLEDVALVSSLLQTQTVPMGCSIEPNDAGIRAAQDMFGSQQVVQRLARSPTLVVDQLREKIGPHHVRVFGMPANSSTAIALVDADAHMKQVGFGTASERLPVASYFDHLDQQTRVPSQSLIRWWFAYADQPILANPGHDIFELPAQVVAVLSEQQWVGQQGRQPTGGQDPAADAFAAGMTKQLDTLRSTQAAYARLCAVFEASLGLQLALEATGQPSLDAWLPNLCGLGQRTASETPEPQTVDGLATWHKLKNGTIVAVVSGGVEIDAKPYAAAERWQAAKFLASSVVPAPAEVPSSAHAAWWWD